MMRTVALDARCRGDGGTNGDGWSSISRGRSHEATRHADATLLQLLRRTTTTADGSGTTKIRITSKGIGSRKIHRGRPSAAADGALRILNRRRRRPRLVAEERGAVIGINVHVSSGVGRIARIPRKRPGGPVHPGRVAAATVVSSITAVEAAVVDIVRTTARIVPRMITILAPRGTASIFRIVDRGDAQLVHGMPTLRCQ